MAQKKKDLAPTSVGATRTVLSDEEAALAANLVRKKELAKMNGGKLPEISDADAEILAATEKHETAERETAVAVGLNDKTTGRVTSDEAKEVRVKPMMLSIEADDQRKKDLAMAFEKSKRDGRRMNLVAGYNFVCQHFVGRDADSVLRDEYVAYRDSAFAALPPEAGDFQFTQEANNYVRKFGGIMAEAICEVFEGQHNVTIGQIEEKKTWERILMKSAEIFIASKPQGKKAVRIDAGATVQCQSSPQCTKFFVPLAWLEYDFDNQKEHWTGNILITKNGDLKWFCPQCRSTGRQQGVPFFSSRSAANVVGKVRENSMRSEGALASLKDAVGYRPLRDEQRDNRFQISEERKRRASRNLFALEAGEPGEYLVIPPNWEVGREDERKVVPTWILIESKGYNSVKILGAGPGFFRQIGASFSKNDLPPAIFAAIKKDQAAQQK